MDRKASNAAITYIGNHDIFVIIGNNKTKEKIHSQFVNEGADIPKLTHTSAILGEEIVMGASTVLMIGVVINCCSRIGQGCTVNTRATIDYDNVIVDDYVHILPGIHLAGTVRVMDR